MSSTRWYLAGRGLALLVRGWRATLRLEVRNRAALDSGGIVALWHGRFVGVLHALFGSGLVTMASMSSDGALAAGAVDGLGLWATRGSGSRRGREALADMEKAMRGGAKLAGLTVDGPRGPWRQVKPGAVVLAQRLGIPVVPTSFSCRHPVVLRSWDRMVLPRPLTRAVVAFGEPWSSERIAGLPIEQVQEELGTAIDELTDALDREVAGKELWSSR